MPSHKVGPKAWSQCSTDGGHHITLQTSPCDSHLLNISISIWHTCRYHLQFKGISLTYHLKEHSVRTKAVFLKLVSLPLPQERIFLFKGKARENNHSWVIFQRFEAHTIRNSKPKWFYLKKKCLWGLGVGSSNGRMCGGGTCVGGCFVECTRESREEKRGFHLCVSSWPPSVFSWRANCPQTWTITLYL